MANPKNLKPFKKGEKRTIDAAKKSKRGVSIKAALKRQFESGKVDIDLIAKGMCLAMPINPAMARLIMEYIDGKVKDEKDINLKAKITLKEKKEQENLFNRLVNRYAKKKPNR